jgi:hypothetical protein
MPSLSLLISIKLLHKSYFDMVVAINKNLHILVIAHINGFTLSNYIIFVLLFFHCFKQFFNHWILLLIIRHIDQLVIFVELALKLRLILENFDSRFNHIH